MFQGLKSIAPGYSGALLCHPPMKRKGKDPCLPPPNILPEGRYPFPLPPTLLPVSDLRL